MKRIISYGLTTIFGGTAVRSILQLQGFSTAQGSERMRILADAFTVPGVILTMFGVMVLLYRAGAFDGLSYAAGYAWRMLIPGRGGEYPPNYAEYVRQRADREKTRCGFLFWIGGIFLLIAAALTVLFFIES